MATESGNELSLEDLPREKMIDYSVLRDITNNFSNVRVIGRGGFGVVYKGVLRDGFVAVKKFRFVLPDRDFRREVNLLTRIEHPNIVQYLGYCAGEHQLICFEYLHKGSLANHITDNPCELEWSVCYKIIQGICLGLQYLCGKRIIHRDIKPENILLDNDMSPKITDFGLSRFLDDEQSRIFTRPIGTKPYMAPETTVGESFRGFTFKSDIFSLGVVIGRMVRGRRMASETDTVLEWSRRLNQLDASEKHTALEQVRACIEMSIKCTSREAVNRPSINDVVHRLDTATDWSVASDMNTIPEQVLSSRSLQITWGETPDYWSWNSRDDSRFGECAELLKVYFLAVTGDIPRNDLSVGASYEVFLVYKLAPSATGLRGGAVLTSSLRLHGERIVATSKVSLDPEAPRAQGVTYPVERSDGWLEIRLAEFDNDGGMLGEEAVIVDLREENGAVKKSGLIIECMEFRSPAM